VSVLCRFLANPGPSHWRAVQHLFRYLKGTIDARLVYRRTAFDPTNFFVTYLDADHGGNPDNGKSTGGYEIIIGGAAVSWSSRLQGIVALLTTEAEYIAAVEAGKEMMWMHQLLQELGFSISSASTINMDNQSGISVSKNPEHHGHMKQLDLCFYWLCDCIDGSDLVPHFVPTTNMVANIFTKSLPRLDVARYRQMLGVEL
jgi:hypothetical protein